MSQECERYSWEGSLRRYSKEHARCLADFKAGNRSQPFLIAHHHPRKMLEMKKVNYWKSDLALIATFLIPTSNERIKEHFVMFVLRLSSFLLLPLPTLFVILRLFLMSIVVVFIHPFILNLLHHVRSTMAGWKGRARDTLFPIHFMALHLIVIYGKAWKSRRKAKAEHRDYSSSFTFRFTHSLWMVIWFACCCLLHRSPNKWEMCVIPILRFVAAFTTRNAGLFFILFFAFPYDDGEKSENGRMLKFYLWFERRKKGGIMQSVILLFIKESYYDVIYVRWRNWNEVILRNHRKPVRATRRKVLGFIVRDVDGKLGDYVEWLFEETLECQAEWFTHLLAVEVSAKSYKSTWRSFKTPYPIPAKTQNNFFEMQNKTLMKMYP